MEIITSEEFYSAYDKLCEQAKKYLIESIDNKPIYKKEIEKIRKYRSLYSFGY